MNAKGSSGSEQESRDESRHDQYPSGHGDVGRILPSGQEPSSASVADTGASGIPSVAELKDLNRLIHDDAGQPERYKLDQPSPLQGCLARAAAE